MAREISTAQAVRRRATEAKERLAQRQAAIQQVLAELDDAYFDMKLGPSRTQVMPTASTQCKMQGLGRSVAVAGAQQAGLWHVK